MGYAESKRQLRQKGHGCRGIRQRIHTAREAAVCLASIECLHQAEAEATPLWQSLLQHGRSEHSRCQTPWPEGLSPEPMYWAVQSIMLLSSWQSGLGASAGWRCFWPGTAT